MNKQQAQDKLNKIESRYNRSWQHGSDHDILIAPAAFHLIENMRRTLERRTLNPGTRRTPISVFNAPACAQDLTLDWLID